MTPLNIAERLPSNAPWVPQSLETIVDKKICRVALNFFEKFVDWICSWICKPYRLLYNEKVKRVHVLDDKTLLFDATSERIVNVRNNCIFIGKKELKVNISSQWIWIKDAAKGFCEIHHLHRPTKLLSKPVPFSWTLDIEE